MLTSAQKKRLSTLFDEFQAILEEVQDISENRRKHYDGRSDRWRESDAGSEFQDGLSNLESTADNLNSALSYWGNLEMGE
jgi:hypothetical protein